MRVLFSATLVWLGLALGASAQTSGSERDAVLGVVQRFFDAMAARDPGAMREVTLPEGRFFALVDGNGRTSMRSSTNDEFARGLAARTETLLERMWEPEVRVHGPIATVWAPYDFHRDGQFSHCGIDAFTLVKVESGWKISGGAYTVEPTGCAPSPLGPPPGPKDD